MRSRVNEAHLLNLNTKIKWSKIVYIIRARWEVAKVEWSFRPNIFDATNYETLKTFYNYVPSTMITSYRIRFLVSAILGLIIGAILLLQNSREQQNLSERNENHLERVVEFLIETHNREYVELTNKSMKIRGLIKEKFNWLLGRKTKPNNFIRLQSKQIRDQVIVFLHLPRTAGNALRQCLREIGRNFSLVLFPDLNDEQRALWDIPHELTLGYREGFDGHVGINVFGLCDQIRRPCSYFTLMRRPLERAISSYFHCRQSLGDPMCNAVNANDMDLRSWVIFQGSVFFRTLLFNSSHCNLQLNTTSLEYNLLNPKKIPCWLKHKLWVDALSDDDQRLLLDFLLGQLENWFAVFGITEDLESTLHMLEATYSLPFKKCNSVIKRNKPDKWTNAIKENFIRADYNAPLNYEEYVELQYDYRVQKALYADYKLYEKLNDIIHLQRQVVFNTLN